VIEKGGKKSFWEDEPIKLFSMSKEAQRAFMLQN
jgi:hypothetical protein